MDPAALISKFTSFNVTHLSTCSWALTLLPSSLRTRPFELYIYIYIEHSPTGIAVIVIAVYLDPMASHVSLTI